MKPREACVVDSVEAYERLVGTSCPVCAHKITEGSLEFLFTTWQHLHEDSPGDVDAHRITPSDYDAMATTDGGFTVNPERCDECGASLTDGECRNEGCDA